MCVWKMQLILLELPDEKNTFLIDDRRKAYVSNDFHNILHFQNDLKIL